MTLLFCNLKSNYFSKLNSKKRIYQSFFYIKRSYKVLFFGSDRIALSSLRKINEFRKTEKLISRLDLVTANVSNNKSIIEKYAQSECIQTISWPLQNLKKDEYDIGLIVAFGHLIKDDVLNQFPLGMINVHPSLLPRYRGAAPIIHTLLNGDSLTGVTLMKIKANVFDVGEIISQVEVPISEDIKLPELTEELSELGATMLVHCMRSLPESLAKATPQTQEGVTYAKKIHKQISEVRWSEMTALQVYNLYRAIYGLYSLTTKFRDGQMKLFEAFLVKDEKDNSNKHVGTLDYCHTNNAIRILCNDRRFVYFKALRIVGKRKISALDFYNGYIKNVPQENRHFVVC